MQGGKKERTEEGSNKEIGEESLLDVEHKVVHPLVFVCLCVCECACVQQSHTTLPSDRNLVVIYAA